MDRHEPDHESRDEGSRRQDRPEPRPVLSAAEGGGGGEHVGGAVAQGEESDGGHAGGEAESVGELGGDD